MLYVKTMNLTQAIKASFSFCLVAFISDILAIAVLYNYVQTGTVQVRMFEHSGMPATIQVMVYFALAACMTYGAIISVKRKVNGNG